MAKKKVLIADDEANIRLLVNRVLGETHIVLETNDGEEAVNITRSQKPDLILMDILMPKMDGYTACFAIKADSELKTIPVIMLSVLGFELNRELAKMLGAEGYVTKPFTSEELLAKIGQFLKSRDNSCSP